ncbi:MAG: hypothetical protein AAB441_05075 [Patescibacteria group bacterium]
MVDDVRPGRLKLILLIEAFIFVIVIVTSLLIFIRRKSQTTKNSTLSPTPTTPAENKMNVPIETKYENPFSEKTQYQNPFSKNTNPFDNLK